MDPDREANVINSSCLAVNSITPLKKWALKDTQKVLLPKIEPHKRYHADLILVKLRHAR